jgi:hypothetical protein
MRNRMKFVEMITGLAEALGSEMSVAKLSIYENSLKRFTDEQIQSAINLAASTFKFFPKPRELIELIEGKKEDQATLAWEALLDTMKHVGAYQSVLFEDGRIARAVNLMGGWQNLCQSEEKNLKFLRNDFMKIFSSMPVDTEPEVLDGIGNLQASAHGYLDRMTKAKVIPCLSAPNGLDEVKLNQLADPRERHTPTQGRANGHD